MDLRLFLRRWRLDRPRLESLSDESESLLELDVLESEGLLEELELELELDADRFLPRLEPLL